MKKGRDDLGVSGGYGEGAREVGGVSDAGLAKDDDRVGECNE